ncbi:MULTISPECIES: GNAT family N-acetyltransferase [unclassified Bacillus (in: firmicutes)]|uniref:GNAT family N-acetyltransferase n=1 Tax=unclassified Bacillus (in: firmicutes) TaxID=185979 RepID=UPI0008E972E4|nr:MULTISPECIES: GNAT family N-acetyltransferase [unclassified Bacillus (in: firmicutes)]SFA70909.1 Protein N-acetyltransferase, RimJ/RimL family [Bacillus sp. UNCCL13]SFQ60920.1 Protein N-acetyltransferase, RimJ/RimL family [Bacillus sp. cl95]
MIFRHVRESDAEKMVELVLSIEAESNYMLFGPGERGLTTERQLAMIKALNEEQNSTIFVAEEDGRLLGYLLARGGSANKTRHSVYIAIGIRSDFCGKGIGTKLFGELENWARAVGVHRLELTVIVENQVGVSLYKKCGFDIEGTKRHSVILNGQYVDEYYMAKLI